MSFISRKSSLSAWLIAAGLCAAAGPSPAATPQTVWFASADGKTEIPGYVFTPQGVGAHPAVVMLHGRAGPYSSNVNRGCTLVSRTSASPCGASGLSKRHMMWGEYWASRGYLAMHVDSFGPRGKAQGFGRGTHDDEERDDVNERTVRPLDAQGALAYLHTRADVVADMVFLQGWSNGASTTLNVMNLQAGAANAARPGYRAALAFYPGCGPRALVNQKRFAVAAPVTVMLGSDDEEVSPVTCRTILDRARQDGSPIEVVWYEGAGHNFDDPGKQHQSVAANSTATTDSMNRAEPFFASVAGRPARR